jgi:drug/metabolite transporter (DMT)-like permease
MGDDARTAHRRGQVYAVGAALAWSTAGILQRELSVDAATQVAGRAFFAVLALLAFVRFSKHGGGLGAFRRLGRAELAVAVFTGIASSAFVVSLNHTTVANVLFMQAVAPLAAALIAWLALGEAITPRIGVAMVVALVGVGVMVGGPGGARGVGLAVSVVMTLCFAISVVITRHRRDISMAPAICLSQALVLIAFAPFSSPGQIDRKDLMLLALLGVTQIGLGLALLTMAARLIPAAEVALISLLEVVLGPLWVWLAFSERPSRASLIGGVIVIAAVVLQAAPVGRYQPRFSSSSDGSSDEVEMPTIASPSPADTRASTSASM